ncbi:unnamed protein product [Rhizophagus irregularis]|nr:unnamed protein product [Rhizophagus irregularis]
MVKTILTVNSVPSLLAEDRILLRRCGLTVRNLYRLIAAAILQFQLDSSVVLWFNGKWILFVAAIAAAALR